MQALIVTLISGLSFLIGGLIIIFIKRKDHFINFCISISFGVLIILSLFELIPEAKEKLGDNAAMLLIIFAIIGFILFKFLDYFIPHHDEGNNSSNNLIHIGIITAIALIVHNIIEGMLLYGYAMVNMRVAYIYALAASLYHLPLGANVAFLLKENRKKMWVYLFLLTITPLVGGVLIHYFNEFLTDFYLGLMLAITLGIIIYIILFELLGKIKKDFNKHTICGILLGVLLMIVGLSV